MSSAPRLDVINPSNGNLIWSLEADTLLSAKAKLEYASELFNDSTRHLALHERIDLMEKLVPHLEAKREEIIDTMIYEGGKPRQDSVVEFNRAIRGIKIAINTVGEYMGRVVPLEYQASSAGHSATTKVFPRGVVLAFSAFNHPLNLIIHQIIPAFATGCPCVVKPAPDTPLSCVKLVEAMHAVGVPDDYVQTVITSDLQIAGELVTSDKIAFFSFIGAARVGWMLRAKLKPGVRCALEHGGIAPCIVTRSADLDIAVSAISKGAFYHAGQVCVSTQRVYVDAEIFDEFVSALVSNAEQLIVGDANDIETDVGPLIRSAEADRIHSWVEEAVEDGAQCCTGGWEPKGNYYRPTILVNPDDKSKVSKQEIFGPVVCIYRYHDFSQALASANSSEFAFQSSIFSRDINEIMRAYNQLEASTVMVNDHTAFRDDAMPFAGLKTSGLGAGGIPYTIEEMQYEKMIVIKN